MQKESMYTLLLVTGITALISINNIFPTQTNLPNFQLKNTYAMVLGYDKSMSNKTIKAAVIDSYYRNVTQNGKIIRWNKTSFPLKVYIQDSNSLPDYYREIVMSAFQTWQRSSEGLVSFEFVEEDKNADIKSYFKDFNDNSNEISMQSFEVKGEMIEGATLVFRIKDEKNNNLDSKRLFSSALQGIGRSLGVCGNSTSIYDVMYPIGTKFNTELTARDLKTLALIYSSIPNITNKPLTQEESSNLFTIQEILSTMNNSTTIDNDSHNINNSIETKLTLAEQYRKKAQYDKAAEEYQSVAEMKDDRRSKSEVYYEIAVMYLDAEEFDKAKDCAEIATSTDINDLTETLPALIDYYTKRSTSAIEQLETILNNNPYNKHAYKLLCQIYREKHHEHMLNATIRKWGQTAGSY